MKRFAVFLLLLLGFVLVPRPTYAEVIRSFNVDIVAHKNGVMDFKETILYDFEDTDRHGIFRTIPLYQKVGDLYRIYKIEDVKVTRDGKKEKLSESSTNENITLKIGNPDRTINGQHEYIISYVVSNGIGSNFKDHDEIYWNVNGFDWSVAMDNVSASVTTDFDAKPSEIICFEGPFGSKDRTCEINENRITSSQIFYPGYNLTLVAVFPPNTFPKSILNTSPPETLSDKILRTVIKNYKYIYLLLNVVLPIILLNWYFKKKNKKSFGSPAVNFDTPEDQKGNRLPPAIAGTIDTAKLEKDDVTATIFDLAIRKYLKIEEEKTIKKILPDKKDLKLTKLKEADDSLLPFEATLFNRIFKEGDSVKISTLKTDFYKTFLSMETEIFQELVKKGYYTKNPKTQKAFLLVFAMFSIFTLNIFLSITLLFLAKKLNARTTLGDEIDYKIDGLKLFLKSMDRNFKWQAEKFYTVEQMIPYAISLGYIDKFMEALKILKPEYKPSWYSGTSNFYTSYPIFSSVASSSITTSAPSSSSGSSGGFSGGGGGGGGGGSW